MMGSKLRWRLDVLQQQLVSLTVLTKDCFLDELGEFLDQQNGFKNMGSKEFNLVVFYLLGLIDKEARDKVITWPLINIATQTKFRKGVVGRVKDLQVQFPWANVQKISESHLINPRGNQVHILDFLLGLSGLAIHLLLKDESIISLSNVQSLNPDEKEIRLEAVSRLCCNEEKKLAGNVFPFQKYDGIKQEVLGRCVELKKETIQLYSKLNKLKKSIVADGLVESLTDVNTELEARYADEVSQLVTMSSVTLQEAAELCKQVTACVKQAREPIELGARHFHLSGDTSLETATFTVVEKLKHMITQIKNQQTDISDERQLAASIKLLRKHLECEEANMNDCLQTFKSFQRPETPKLCVPSDLKELFLE